MLLEVAEDFKQKYLQTAQKIPAAFIISALNILNEAEINYKQARNKRLHVELTLIKLSYLQQALELANNEGGLSKKKIVEGSKTLAFRALPIIKFGQEIVPVKTTASKNTPPLPEAKLIIEEQARPVATTPKATSVSSSNVVAEPKASMASLNKLRQKISEQNKNGGNEAKLLSEEDLHKVWGLFIQLLRDWGNHSAILHFKTAELAVIDNNSIGIVADSDIQKAFIETERAQLIEHLQNHFNNRALTYQVTVVEKERADEPQEVTLTRKQQYLKIIEEFPWVKELKERLKLELE